MQLLTIINRFNKPLSVLMIYVMFIHLAIPGVSAMGQMGGQMHGTKKQNTLAPVFSVIASEADNAVADISKRLEKPDMAISSAITAVATVASSGPGQAESNSFSINTNDAILNEFTGDMNYSLPLMDIEGFPITLTYNANIGMEQEASWVGLGWDLSLGSINRELRGIPDDFSGDKIKRLFKAFDEKISDGKKNGVSLSDGVGAPIGKNWEYAAKNNLTLDLGTTYRFMKGRYISNYTGVGHTLDLSMAVSASFLGIGGSGNLGYNSDTQNGIGVSKGIGFMAVPTIFGTSLGGATGGVTWGSNSRSGLRSKNTYLGLEGGVKVQGIGIMTSTVTGSSRTFGVQTYMPRNNANILRSGLEKSISGGVTVLLIPFYGNTSYNHVAYQSAMKIAATDNSSNAYGYYYLSRSAKENKVLLDFARGKGAEVDQNSIHLNFSLPTHDIFYCNAPGISTQYRANRYEAYKLKDPLTTVSTTLDNTDLGFTINGGGTTALPAPPFIVGVDGSVGSGTTSGTSTFGGFDHPYLNYMDANLAFDKKEYYLKTIGEQTPVNTALYDAFHGDKAVSIEVLDVGQKDIVLSGKFNETDPLVGNTIPPTNYNLNRPHNIVHYREYTGKDLSLLTEPVKSYAQQRCEELDNPWGYTNVPVVGAQKPEHLIAAVEVVNESGMRYYFGTPSYNYQQKEVTFSASGLKDDAAYKRTGLVRYNANDNSLLNNKGRQGLYDEVTTPTYAHSLLLSTMVSSDYIDVTGNGPSSDDQGNYYQINYTNLYGKENPFKWRLPMTGESSQSAAPIEQKDKLAYLEENMVTDPWDDMAHYTYGEKDMWYAQTVHSKNFIAVFCLEDRIDQYAAKTENGGLDTGKSGKLLKKIMLFSKGGDLKKVFNSAPLQIIEFEYDYSSCPNYMGNKNSHNGVYGANDGKGTGKLTLKKVYIYSGKSQEGKTAPFVFTYSTNNPSYAINSTDKWGNYKPNDPNLPNHIYPYAEQDIYTAAQHIQAWKLVKIKNPSGGEVGFQYEPDTYSHVQNERAMRMFSIAGMSNISNLTDLNELASVTAMNQLTSKGVKGYLRNPNDKKDPYTVVYFKLDQQLTNADKAAADLEFKKKYLTNEAGEIPDEMLFSMQSVLGNDLNNDRFERVVSKAKLAKEPDFFVGSPYAGVVGNGAPYAYGYVVLKALPITENANNYRVTELQKANWEFARKLAPYTIYGKVDYDATTPGNFCDYKIGLDAKVIFGADFNKLVNKRDYGIKFDPDKSFIRLFEPDNVKVGGGSRVVGISYHDNWGPISGGEVSTVYNWQYIYGEMDGREMTTTGVAAYEPVISGEENPFYNLLGYDVERALLPTEKRAHITPLTEIAYPAPVVGYGAVVTKFDGSAMSAVKAIGKEKTTFYTAYDYPVVSRNTAETSPIMKINRTGKNAIKEKRGFIAEKVAFSEGFVVITNDFHGKIRENTTYNAVGDVLAHSKYNYLNPYTGKMKYLQPNGTVIESATPRELDIYSESWKVVSEERTANTSNTVSVGVFITPPMFIPYGLWSPGKYNAVTFSITTGIVLNKMINYSAVVESVETTQLGSYNTAKNHLWDPKSGGVLLSSLKDEFDDALYDFSYPAHWKYDHFAAKYLSDGAITKQFTGSGNQLTLLAGAGLTFNVGDELEITSGANIYKAWVLTVSGNTAKLIDATGQPTSGINWTGATVKILNTGVKNILSAEMMSVSTKLNPLNESTLAFTFPETKIINASAVTFEENHNVPCLKGTTGINSFKGYLTGINNPYQINTVINPFLVGLKGNLKSMSGYAYQVGRTNFVDPNGIRQDGVYTSYVPFYKYSAGQWKTIKELTGNYELWRSSGNVSLFSEDGTAVQTTNPLLINNASLTAYNAGIKPVQAASASNAKVQDFGYDGFEIYALEDGTPTSIRNTPHFSLFEALSNGGGITSAVRHSGKSSMMVAGTASATFSTRGVEAPFENNIVDNKYEVKACNCIYGFEPKALESYQLSVWAKFNNPDAPSGGISVYFYNAQNQLINPSPLLTVGEEVIDGWQKIEGTFTVPANTASVKFEFKTTGQAVYFDDFRVHPFKSQMISSVYDPVSLLPIAEHDDSNYTIFYNYDENYQMVRVRVETAEGIQTISETESGFKKN